MVWLVIAWPAGDTGVSTAEGYLRGGLTPDGLFAVLRANRLLES